MSDIWHGFKVTFCWALAILLWLCACAFMVGAIAAVIER